MKISKLVTFIFGVLMIILGTFCLFNPTITYMTLGYIIGVNMVIDAIGNIVLWAEKETESDDGFVLASAIISLVFGIILIGSTALQIIVDMAIVYLAAIWMIVLGIIRIIFAIRFYRIKKILDVKSIKRRWWIILIFGFLLIICGIVSLFNPTGLIIAIGINLGLSIIVAGANMIAFAI